MWQTLRASPLAFVLSVAIHALLVGLLLVNFDRVEKPRAVVQKVDIVQATVIDMTRIRAEQERKRQAEEAKRREEQRKVEERRKAEAEKKRRAEAAAEKKRQAELKRKAEAEKKRQAKLAAENKRKEKERQRQAQLKKEQEEKARKEAEAQRKAEEKRKAEEQRKAEAERKRAEDEARAQAEREAALRAELEAEANASLVDEYTARIRRQIERNWRLPVNSQGLSSTIRVRLIPGGEVVSVTTIRSSGNAVFDRSVETAVEKASPLPWPSEPAVARYFREIQFEFEPIN